MSNAQLSIFQAVHRAYAQSGGQPVRNEDLYDQVGEAVGCTRSEFRARKPIGRAGAKHSPMTRTARWVQQTMRDRGWLQRVPGERGVWRLTDAGKAKLHTPAPGRVLIGFSTTLGVALVADCRDAFSTFGAPIHLILCSPVYPISKPRPYGGVAVKDYVAFMLECLEPVVKWLAPGGSVLLQVGVDVFEPGSPARSTFIERLVIALEDDLGLKLMDRAIWHNPSKPPTPVQWASIRRVQLCSAFEFCLWFCSEPARCFADNRRVLRPHTPRHAALIARGGEQRKRSYADGRHTKRVGSYGAPTPGAIPRNVLTCGHSCASQRRYKQRARDMGLPVHGAPFSLSLARFWIEFLTSPGQTVVDLMAGSITTGVAAEMLGRNWVCTELHAEFVLGASTRFEGDVWINPVLLALVPDARGHQRALL